MIRNPGHPVRHHATRVLRCLLVILISTWVLAVGHVAAQQGGGDLQLHSKAAVVIDAASGRVLYEKNAHEPLPPASVTKVMTLILALEAIERGEATWDELVTASARAASMGGTQIWLETGEQMAYGDLLWAIAVGSANDAAVAIAEHLAGSEAAFAEMMNERARELGAQNTHFLNASGLPPADVGMTGEHVTSAYDIAIISRHALTLPKFRELVSTWGPVVMRPNGSGEPVLWSLNSMLRTYPGMDGIKTGYTREAGYNLSATAERQGVRVIAVNLGAATPDQRQADIQRLLDYGFSQLTSVPVAKAGEELTVVRVRRGLPAALPVTVKEDVFATVLSRQNETPEIRFEWPLEGVVAPVKQGDQVGTLVVTVNGIEVGRHPLIAAGDVEEARFSKLFIRNLHALLSGTRIGEVQ